MSIERAYDEDQFRRAVNLSALLGWAVTAALTLLDYATHALHVGLVSFGLVLFWSAIIGLPIAFVGSWLIGAPILWRLMTKPIGWLDAIAWGLAIAGAMAIVGIGLYRLWDWQLSLDPNFRSQVGGGDYIQDVNGVLTPYGWFVTIQSALEFTLTGGVVALVVRWSIGPGKAAPKAAG